MFGPADWEVMATLTTPEYLTMTIVILVGLVFAYRKRIH